MRKVLAAFVVAGSLALSGCASGGGGGISPDAIKQIQDATKQFCSFIPDRGVVSTILNLVGGSSITNIVDIARKICDTVNKVSVRRGGKVKMVATFNGKKVVITGTKVSR